MDISREHYLRCPYCGVDGEHSKKQAKSVGLFRIKELYNNVIILKCMKCSKVCRKMTVGKTLIWQDMSVREKSAFKKVIYSDYKSKLNKEEKNGKKV